MIRPQNDLRQKGFTLVELTVVVAVIAILALVGYVAYGGIQNRAREAVVRSDLKAAADILHADLVRSGGSSYPESISDADKGGGLPASEDTSYLYEVDNGDEPPTYCLTATNGTKTFNITEQGSVAEGACS